MNRRVHLNSAAALSKQWGPPLSDIPVLAVTGERHVITFDSLKPTLLYVLSPSCIWCERNMDNITELAKTIGIEHRLVAVSTSDTNLQTYVQRNALPFDVYFVDSAALRQELGFTATPQTAIVSANGMVETVWRGAWNAPAQREIEARFSIKLPGLRVVSAKK